MADEKKAAPPESLQIQLTFTPQANGTYSMRMDYSTAINPLALPPLLMTALAESQARIRQMLEAALVKLEGQRIVSPQAFFSQQKDRIKPN